MSRAVLRISSDLNVDFQCFGLTLKVWKSGQGSFEAAMAIRVHLESIREPVPALSLAQAYAANVIGRHQDALYAARQQEAQRA